MLVARARQSCWQVATLARRVSTTTTDHAEEPNRELRNVVTKQAEQQASTPQPLSVGVCQLFFISFSHLTESMADWNSFVAGRV
jgi:hypothetical protein